MLDIFKNWTKRYFSDPEAIVLLVLIFLILMLVLYMGSILAPVIASVVLAYLLQGLVNGLNVTKLPRFASVLIVYLGFLGIFLGVFLILGPLIWQQFVHLVAELPSMLKSAQQLLYLLPEKFPEYVTKENIDSFTMDMIQ
ncbi:MAG TPA: AI-2E family transporter, partial [Gammaproteobacteria bacterium]|nr:AI-2E family transporter [Gammaproteobacteria bacterium]